MTTTQVARATELLSYIWPHNLLSKYTTLLLQEILQILVTPASPQTSQAKITNTATQVNMPACIRAAADIAALHQLLNCCSCLSIA